MKSRRQFLFVLFFLLAILLDGIPIWAQQAPQLQTLMQRAINKNHSLANKGLDVELTKNSKQSLADAYVPRISSLASYTYLKTNLSAGLPASTFPILDIPISAIYGSFNTHSNIFFASLGVEELLFDGFKIGNYKKALDEKIKAQSAMLENDRQDIISSVSESYDLLALLKKSKAVLDNSDMQLAAQTKVADKALSYGLITKYEHKKIEVARAQLQAKLVEYDGKRDLALRHLQQLTGIGMDTLALINNEMVPYLEADTHEDVHNRPEFASLEATSNAYNFELKSKRNHLVPTAAAFGSASYLNLSDLVFQNNAGTITPNAGDVRLQASKLQLFPTFMVGVGIKWDLFDGFQSKREIQKIKIELQQNENKKADAKELLSLGLAKANSDYSIANAQVAAKAKEKEVSRDALELAANESKNGLIKPADLITAISDSQKAELEYIQAVYNQRRAAVDMHRAAGNLTVDRFK